MNAVARRSVLAAIIMLAAGVRLLGLWHSNSLWYDEFCSVECSTGRGLFHEHVAFAQFFDHPIDPTSLDDAPSWPTLWSSLGEEQYPPLYFLLLRVWRFAFGDSEAALRSLSVLSGIFAILLFYDAGRNLFGAGPALWASLMFALAPPMVNMSLQIRSYMPMLAMLMGALAATTRIAKFGPSPPRLIALGGCLLAAMLTHYFALGPAVATAVYSVFAFRGATRWRVAAALGCAAVAFVLLWGQLLWQQRAAFDRNHAYLGEPVEGHLWHDLSRATLLPMRFFGDVPRESAPAASLAAVLYFLPFMPSFMLLRKQRDALVLVGLWLVCTVALVAGLDAVRSTKQLTLIRYTLPAGPAVYLLISALPSGQWKRLGYAMAVLCVFTCVYELPGAYTPEDGNWRNMAEQLHAVAKPGDAIILTGGRRGDWFAGWLYLGLSYYLPDWPGPVVLLRQPLNDDLRKQLSRCPHVWLVGGAWEWPGRLFPGERAAFQHSELLIGSLYRIDLNADASMSNLPSPARMESADAR